MAAVFTILSRMHSSASDRGRGAGVDPRVARTRNDVLAAAITVLIDDGWEALTQPNVARVAGYSKGTVYAHWPERLDLLRDAFARYGETQHHEGTGDLRADLIGELTCFRTALVDNRLDRILAILAERSPAVPEIVEIRDEFVEEGERPIRGLLGTIIADAELEAATLMLCGMVLDAVLLHGSPPDDAVLEAAVDQVLRGVDHAVR